MPLTVRREADLRLHSKQRAAYPNIGPGSTPFGQMVIAGIQGATDNIQRQASLLSQDANFNRDAARAIVADKFERHQVKISQEFNKAQTEFARRTLDVQELGLGLRQADIDLRRQHALASYKLKKKEIKLQTIAQVTSGVIKLGAAAYGHLADKSAAEQKRLISSAQTQLGEMAVEADLQAQRAVSRNNRRSPGAYKAGRAFDAQANINLYNQSFERSMEAALRSVISGASGELNTDSVAALTNYSQKLVSSGGSAYRKQVWDAEKKFRGEQFVQDTLTGINSGGFAGVEGERELRTRLNEQTSAGAITPHTAGNLLLAREEYETILGPKTDISRIFAAGDYRKGMEAVDKVLDNTEERYGAGSEKFARAQRIYSPMMQAAGSAAILDRSRGKELTPVLLHELEQWLLRGHQNRTDLGGLMKMNRNSSYDFMAGGLQEIKMMGRIINHQSKINEARLQSKLHNSGFFGD